MLLRIYSYWRNLKVKQKGYKERAKDNSNNNRIQWEISCNSKNYNKVKIIFVIGVLNYWILRRRRRESKIDYQDYLLAFSNSQSNNKRLKKISFKVGHKIRWH